MTKALEIVGKDNSNNALEWTKEVLRVRFEEVLALRDNALNSQDIEGVHELRVASRRLRSALRDFSPLMKSKLLKECRKELKQIADKLGQARDDDVVIAALEKLRNRAKSENVRNDIEKKIEKLRTQRTKMQNQLVKILADSSLESLGKKFAKAID